MFCPKCGNRVTGNERFCGKCGTPIQQAAPQQPQQPQQFAQEPQQFAQAPQEGYQSNYGQAPVRPAVDPKLEGSLKTQFMILAVASLLIGILWYMKGLKIEVLGMVEQSISFHALCKEGDVGAFSTLNLLAALIAAVVYILPVLTNTIAKRRRLILPQVLSIVNVLCLAVMLLAINEANQYAMGMGGYKINFLGWLHILLNVVLFIMPIITARKTKVYGK